MRRSHHEHAARCTEAFAERGCDNGSVAQFTNQGLRKAFTTPAEERDSVRIVSLEKQALVFWETAPRGYRSTATPGVDAVADVCDGFILAA